MKKRVIVWFRQDLRLHDNEALQDAIQVADEIIPVYVFDDRTFKGQTAFGFQKTGEIRKRFILESVRDLRENLRTRGSDLIVRTGLQENVLFELAQSLKTNWIFCNRERTPEEVAVQDSLESKLWSIGQEIRYSRGKMLYYTADLPYPVTHTPDSFKAFLKETERIVSIRDPLPEPIKPLPIRINVEPGDLPTSYLEDEIFAVPVVQGGEQEGLQRLGGLRWQLESNGAVEDAGLSDNPRLSPWLAQGCLSAKRVYHSLNSAASSDNEHALGIQKHLLMRDYHRLMVKKYGKQIFARVGVVGVEKGGPEIVSDTFLTWAHGETGVPIVDAAMRHLNLTGFMPYQLRYLSAKYLVEEMNLSWRLGASLFESLLIDYDPCSNWSNWCRVAGVGPDARDDKRCNYEMQANRLDPDGEYIGKWLNAFRTERGQFAHQ